MLLSATDGAQTAELLLRQVLEVTQAARGFIVVREGDTFEKKFDVQFDALSNDARRFSRSLVRHAIATRQVVHSADASSIAGLVKAESVAALECRGVLVAPLECDGIVWGAIYLDHPSASGFDEEARIFVERFAELAALFLKRAAEVTALEQRARSLERDLLSQADFEGIVTRHPRMLEALGVVAQVADSDASVLVCGETGTGKELIARALHINSSRRTRPFVALHCTALPATILESELFGHARGAFTGADRDRTGRIASAHGGTLFLDEVAEIPLEAQAKLLRFLQFGEIQRLGSDRIERVDVRVVAATHRDLGMLVAEEKFRRDLYFRLNVIEIVLPPLRERASDIPLLLEVALRRFWKRGGEPRWSRSAQQALVAYEWPGNVRELEHVCERACLLARSDLLEEALLPSEIRAVQPRRASSPELFMSFSHAELETARSAAVAEVERTFVEGLLKKSENNVSLAARTSGIHRGQLQRLIARHKVRTT
ncbi:MAG: sigma 54-interacting transcriptional regulator [Polyangiaceae bacterium]|nr:sigma 54-interacting transcriptional regulator [Polyangiaceae bacterium]